MKNRLALALIAWALSLALAFTVGHFSPTRDRVPAPAPRAATLEDDLSRIAARYAELDAAGHRMDLTQDEKADRWEQHRRRRRAEMQGAHARHGRDFPGESR